MATNNKNRPVESTRDTEDRPECVLILLLMMLENPSSVFVFVGFYSTIGVDGQSRFILRSRRA